MSKPDVVIIGGGIIGAACADAFAGRDLSVTLLDSGTEPGIATPAAGGMLAPLAECRSDDPLLSLSVLARDLYGTLVPRLQEETGIDVGHWVEGILQVAFDEDDATRLKNDIAWQRQQGFKVDWVAVEEIREDYPGLSEAVVGGKLAPEDGALEPELLHRAYLERAESNGATIRRGVKVQRVLTDAHRTIGCATTDEEIHADHVVIAAGSWSSALGGLPRPLSVQPIRGQMIALDWPTDVKPSIIYSAGGYVLHRQGVALAGTTMEHVGFDASTTTPAVTGILRAAQQIYPGLNEATILRQWAGLRPVTPDGVPIIGPDPSVEHLWYAVGHGRNGILYAALTSQILLQQLLEEPIERDVTAVDPARFWRL